MPKKQKAEVEQVASPEAAAAPAPAKKPATPKAKSAAATHKTPAKRTSRATATKNAVTAPEAAVEETVEIVSVETAAPAIAETPGVIAEVPSVVEEVVLAIDVTPVEHYMPGTPEEREEIARIAYSYYIARNFAPGDPLIDWLRAEDEYRSRRYAAV